MTFLLKPKSVLRHLLNAAKACIALRWNDPDPLSIPMWLIKVEDINKLEDLVLSVQNKRERYKKTWLPLNMFIYRRGQVPARYLSWGLGSPSCPSGPTLTCLILYNIVVPSLSVHTCDQVYSVLFAHVYCDLTIYDFFHDISAVQMLKRCVGCPCLINKELKEKKLLAATTVHTLYMHVLFVCLFVRV